MSNPHKTETAQPLFGGYTVSYIKNFLTWLSLMALLTTFFMLDFMALWRYTDISYQRKEVPRDAGAISE